MARLVLAIALILALDMSGALAAAPACDPGAPIACSPAVDAARAALPPDHASIVGTRVVYL